jgi:hypothetical protein
VPEYIIPTTVPPNQPSWARWGWRIDLVDWINFEIYEVEPYNVGAPYMAGHGVAQVQRYSDELNSAYEGVGIGFVNTWKPGNRVKDMRFLTWNGFAEVRAWLNEPGVIVFEAQWTKKAYDLVAEICALTAWFLILRGSGAFQGQLEPQPGMAPSVPPFWLPPGELPPLPTATIS